MWRGGAFWQDHRGIDKEKMWPMEHNSDDKNADGTEEAARKESPTPD